MNKTYLLIGGVFVAGIVAYAIVSNRKGSTGNKERTDKETKVVDDVGKENHLPDKPIENETKSPEVTVIDFKQGRLVRNELANNITEKNADIISRLAATTCVDSGCMGDYLGVVINLCPVPPSDRSIDAYFRLMDVATKRIDAVAKAYFASNALITASGTDALNKNASCSKRSWTYATMEEKYNTQWEKASSEVTNAKTTGLLSMIGGLAYDKNKLTKESFQTARHTFSKMPISVCDQVEITESVLASVNAITMAGLMTNFVSYLKGLSTGPSVKTFFNITEDQIEKWSKSANL